MKVYLVWLPVYSFTAYNKELAKIFQNKEDAEHYVKNLKRPAEIEAHTVEGIAT